MSQKSCTRGLWWVKRDFRINDNDALVHAIRSCERVTALFIIEPSLCRAPETSLFHYRAWQQAAEQLRNSLQGLGTHLHIMCGEVVEVLSRLHDEQGFDALFSHEETGSDITYQRDRAVQAWTGEAGVPWHQATQNGVIRGLQSRDHRMPVIRERLMNTPPQAAPSAISGWTIKHTGQGNVIDSTWPCFSLLSGRPLDTRISEEHTQQVTERDAHADLHSFLHDRGVRYSGGISSPNTAFTAGSRLSAHLAWGTLSLRQVFHATWQRDRELASESRAGAGTRDGTRAGAQDSAGSDIRTVMGNGTGAYTQVNQWRKSLKAFQSRLHWHDHFMQRLESAPAMQFQALNPAYRQLEYADDERLLNAWQNGQTGLPLIDACMRCLAATGFLNFRMRAMIVSAACFGFAQSWQSLQYPLARLFLDYEPGIHFSQIQMQAGIVGINTLRVYSPHKQLLDQDPQTEFVKRWIPELREFDALQICEYNTRTLGDYPEPIADIKANTRIIRDQVYAIRNSEVGRKASATVLDKHGSRLPGNDRTRRPASGKRKPKAAKVKTRAETQTKANESAASSAQMTLDLGD